MIKKRAALWLLLVGPCFAWGKESINPTISPWFYDPETQITVIYDVTGTSLADLTEAFAWVWIPGKNIDAKYNVNPANADVSATNTVKFVKSMAEGKILFTLSFTPSSLFDADISNENQFGILLKGNDWSDGQTTDFIAEFWKGDFQLRLIQPAQTPFVGAAGEDLVIEAETPIASNYNLFINGNLIDTQNDITAYTYTHLLEPASNYAIVELTATDGAETAEFSFQIIFSGTSPGMARPTGIIPGINYSEENDTKVTLCLWAPHKSSVHVFGDFTDWKVLPEYLMKKDGEYFWLEVEGLIQEQEYAFQYWVDETLYIADPYADKILDPDDQYIPSETYPDLKLFPVMAMKSQWYFNRVSVLQTGQQEYEWQTTDFDKPEKEKLVIYELLLRDFFANGDRNYQNLTDTLRYFKRLGINAIELMPITEFNGNESWGYNPTFMFAPDKYYGTKNKLKEFIDRCHAEGIAVILDVVMNQQDIPNPYVLMYFDFDSGKPTADNPWFNQDATHPYNVFFDLNHESTYTQSYLDTVNYYWTHEYKFDGYRFDLSKGFTQKNSGGDVTAWGKYDASRISILKRMADKIWEHSPDAYVILEHFAEDQEEKELASYGIGEGNGMLLWGNYNGVYSQNLTGNAGADFSSIYHGNRNWEAPHLIGYMESHDEERLMYRNLQNGKAVGPYNAKNLSTALDRMKAANVLFFTIPGPKMLWQFGELGYDQSINRCPDGTTNEGCRVAPKPVHWEYQENEERLNLYKHIAELLMLRNSYHVFTEGEATIQTGTSLVKQMGLKNASNTNSPTDASEMNVHIVANFDVIAKGASIEFLHAGTWYDYYTGHAISVDGIYDVTLRPGEYRLYTDYALKDPVTSTETEAHSEFSVYPNPVKDRLYVSQERVKSVTLYSAQGKQISLSKGPGDAWYLGGLPNGFYIVKIEGSHGVKQAKIIKQ